MKFQWSTAVCFCVLTIGCTVFACVNSARTTSDNLAIIQANTTRDVALSSKTSAPKVTFTLGDNMAKVMKAQGPPREIWDGCKASNDDGYKVWVYWQSPGVPDNLDSYSANNKMDIVDFDSGGHVAYWDNHTGDLCVGR